MNGSEKRQGFKILRWTGDGSGGFTLIELMVVITLIAILLAVATPATVSYLRQKGVREAADQLGMDLQRAKMLAVSRNTNCFIDVDTANNRYSIELPDRTVETIELARFRGGVTFTAVGGVATSNSITFNSRGLSNPSGTIFLTNADGTATFRLRTSAAGGISQETVSN